VDFVPWVTIMPRCASGFRADVVWASHLSVMTSLGSQRLESISSSRSKHEVLSMRFMEARESPEVGLVELVTCAWVGNPGWSGGDLGGVYGQACTVLTSSRQVGRREPGPGVRRSRSMSGKQGEPGGATAQPSAQGGLRESDWCRRTGPGEGARAES